MLDLSALALHACQVVVDNEVCSMLPAAKLSCRQVVVGVPAGQQLLACNGGSNLASACKQQQLLYR